MSTDFRTRLSLAQLKSDLALYKSSSTAYQANAYPGESIISPFKGLKIVDTYTDDSGKFVQREYSPNQYLKELEKILSQYELPPVLDPEKAKK